MEGLTIGWKLVRQPNGKSARWSGVVDAYTAWNLDPNAARQAMEDGTFDLFGIPVERADANAILSAVAELPLAEWWQGAQWMAAHGGHEAVDMIALVRDTLVAGQAAPALVVLDTEGDWDDQGDAYRASAYRATLVRVLDGPTQRYATRDALADIQAATASIPSNAVVGIGSHVDSLVLETLGARLERAGQDQRAWTLVTGRN